MNSQKLICVTIGFVLGILIWALSPYFTGHTEPWDGAIAYYLIALFVSGVIGFISYPKNLIFTVSGIYLGQIGYLLLFRPSPLFIIGIFLIGLFSLSALWGGLVARNFLEEKTKKTS